MTADELFPATDPRLEVAGVPRLDEQGVWQTPVWVLRACRRCRAVVRLSEAVDHARWHRSVDTDTTTAVAGGS